MKNILRLGILAFIITSAINAEESGAFVGVDLGVGNMKMEVETTESGGTPPSSLYHNTTTTNIHSNFGFRYGIMGGYKWFFTQRFGLRVYAQLNNALVHLKDVGSMAGVNLFNILGNADLLYNVYTDEENAAGLFAGLSLGYAFRSGESIRTAKANGLDYSSSVDIGVNAGVRGIIAKHHGVEVFYRYGIIAGRGFDESDDGVNHTSVDVIPLQPHSFGVRYTYNF